MARQENTNGPKYQPHKTHAPLSISALRVLLGVDLAFFAPPTLLSALLSSSALQLPLCNRQPLELKLPLTLTQDSIAACAFSTS